MSARFYWEQPRPQPILATPQRRPRRRQVQRPGWWIGAGLTLLFLGWAAFRVMVRPAWAEQLPPVLAESLALLEVATAFTLVVLWLALWWRWRSGPTYPAFTHVSQLHELSPRAFESFVARLFRQKGYRVARRGGSGDRGVDLELVKPDGKRAIVQCKRYRSKIGPEIARELYGTLIHEGAAHAFLVTTAEISEATRQWAQGKSMTLVDGETLLQIAAELDAPAAAGDSGR
jgi:restriction system protein